MIIIIVILNVMISGINDLKKKIKSFFDFILFIAN